MVIAALGTVLAAGYLLWMFQKVAFGAPKEEFEHDPDIHDLETTEWLAWMPMVILIVVLGFLPSIIFDVTNPAVSSTVQAAFGG